MPVRFTEEERVQCAGCSSAAAVVAAGLIVAVRRRTPRSHRSSRRPPRRSTARCRPSGQRFCGTRTAQILSWDGIPLDVTVAFPPAPADGADGPYPVIGIYHGWGGTKLALTGADAQRALTRGYAVFTMTDRGWGDSCGARDAHRPALRRQGLHPPDAQRLRGARRAVRARPARRRRRDRPAEDRRHRRLLRRRHVDRARRPAQPHAARRRQPGPVDEPARQADAASPRPSPEFTWTRPRLRADTRTAARSTTSPTRPTSAAATASASRSRTGTTRSTSPARCSATTRRSGPIRRADITGWKSADRHRRPVRRQPRGRPAMVDELTANHSALLHRRLDRARARRCWPTAGTTTCSRSTSRCATTTRSARSTRTRRSRCSTSTSATTRAPARSPPPTAPR